MCLSESDPRRVGVHYRHFVQDVINFFMPVQLYVEFKLSCLELKRDWNKLRRVTHRRARHSV